MRAKLSVLKFYVNSTFHQRRELKEKHATLLLLHFCLVLSWKIFFYISSLGLAQALGIEGDREEQKRMGGEGEQGLFSTVRQGRNFIKTSFITPGTCLTSANKELEQTRRRRKRKRHLKI